jgi:uncharacterized SAM-binding protein YcdF (DUF218 family)
LILVFISYNITSNLITGPLLNRYTSIEKTELSSPVNSPEFVVVLGSGSSSNPDISLMSRIGYTTLVRLMEGIRIHKLFPHSKLILSGGSRPEHESSARLMSLVAEAIGVDHKNIIIESTSRDTKDEARIISRMIGDKSFYLVTSETHMPRSLALFKKHGMHPIPSPVHSLNKGLYMEEPNPLFPSSINIRKTELALHEYMGMIWGNIRGQI